MSITLPVPSRQRMRAISRSLVYLLCGERDTGVVRGLSSRAVWQTVRAQRDLSGALLDFTYKPTRLKFSELVQSPDRLAITDDTKRSIILLLTLHLAVNSEHTFPHPIIIALYKLATHDGHQEMLVVESRDLGPGLGDKLKYVGQHFSSRPYNLQRIVSGKDHPDGGAGLFIFSNQVLNGCRGTVTFESNGQKFVLGKKADEITEISLASTILGTRIRAFLPLAATWVPTPSGFGDLDHFYLPPELKLRRLASGPVRQNQVAKIFRGTNFEQDQFFDYCGKEIVSFKPNAEWLILNSVLPRALKDELLKLYYRTLGDIWR